MSHCDEKVWFEYQVEQVVATLRKDPRFSNVPDDVLRTTATVALKARDDAQAPFPV